MLNRTATRTCRTAVFRAVIAAGVRVAHGESWRIKCTSRARWPPQYLRCEYHVDPSGIDVRRPRLSWEVSDPRRGAVQSAYRVLAAGSLASLNDELGDLWDSGAVASDQTSQVAYAGGSLTSRAVCFWKVRTWDGAGVTSPWSGPGRWSMGRLDPGDWVAEWIDYDEEEGEPFDPLTPYFSGRRAVDGESRLHLPPPHT